MIVEYIRYTIAPDRQDEFVRDYTAARQPLLSSASALNFELSQCVEDPSQFIVRIEWTSAEDHLQKFRGSAEFRAFFEHIRAYVADIDEMRHYRQR